MAYDIHVEHLEPQTVLSLTAAASPATVGQVVPAGIAEACAHVATSGGRFAGPPMVVYPEAFEEGREVRVEICVPIHGEVPETDRLLLAELPPVDVATTIHRGAYGSITDAYRALGDWVLANGREIAGAPRETYLNDPAQVAESEILTRVDWPVV